MPGQAAQRVPAAARDHKDRSRSEGHLLSVPVSAQCMEWWQWQQVNTGTVA
jgi:hypothetical protein